MGTVKYMVCFLVGAMLIFIGAGCGSNSKKMTNENYNSENFGKLAKKGHYAILQAPGLNDTQKMKLAEILKGTYFETGKIKFQLSKLKIDLFSAITNPDYNAFKVNELKTEMARLEQVKLELVFKSLEDVQKVIGRNPETANYLKDIMKEETGTY